MRIILREEEIKAMVRKSLELRFPEMPSDAELSLVVEDSNDCYAVTAEVEYD